MGTRNIFLLLLYAAVCITALNEDVSKQLPRVQYSNLSHILSERCALLGLPPGPYAAGNATTTQQLELLDAVRRVYERESLVFVGRLDAEPAAAHQELDCGAPPIAHAAGPVVTAPLGCKSNLNLALFKRRIRDRSCLIQPPSALYRAHPQPYDGDPSVESLVRFVNRECGAFRTSSGALTPAGLRRERILRNLYGVGGGGERGEGEREGGAGAVCDRVRIPTNASSFLRDYLLRSKPVVIEDAVRHWPALRKWTNEFLLRKYGSSNVHVKLTPDGNFEGVESAELWSEGGRRGRAIPLNVLLQLSFPDLVVVRPASAEMKFSAFMDLVMAMNKSYSAYLEYSSIPYYMADLESDMEELPLVAGLLHRHHLNMWLSDGRTLGKLHFDPYDNFLCQLSGQKKLVLFDPHHNENLYEGHIQEAKLSFDNVSGTFHRHLLLESTSMVMSPVDIIAPNLQRFPNYSKANKLECVLQAGDALFLPAFWWHEVQSYPDPLEHRNLAVNFWYEPMFTKEFPCAECRLRFNLFYRQLLEILED